MSSVIAAARIREFILLVVTAGTLTFSGFYDSFQDFQQILEKGPPPGDLADYLAIYRGPQDIRLGYVPRSHRDYRVVVPYLARLVPLPPRSLSRSERQFDELVEGALRFAILNALFTFGSSLLAYYFCRWFGFSVLLSLFGSVLYLSLTGVNGHEGIPQVDSGFFFVFGVGALAILKRCQLLLLVSCTLGIFIKEPMVLILVLIGLLPATVRERARRVAARPRQPDPRSLGVAGTNRRRRHHRRWHGPLLSLSADGLSGRHPARHDRRPRTAARRRWADRGCIGRRHAAYGSSPRATMNRAISPATIRCPAGVQCTSSRKWRAGSVVAWRNSSQRSGGRADEVHSGLPPVRAYRVARASASRTRYRRPEKPTFHTGHASIARHAGGVSRFCLTV